MGCHTWLYKNINSFTQEEKNKIMADKIVEIKNEYIMTCSLEKWLEQTKHFESDVNTEEYYNNAIAESNREIKAIENGSFKTAIKDMLTIKYKGKKYLNLDCNGNYLVRVYGYPEDKFTDADTLIKWLYEYDQNSITYYDGKEIKIGMCKLIEERIRNFFNENEDALIDFG